MNTLTEEGDPTPDLAPGRFKRVMKGILSALRSANPVTLARQPSPQHAADLLLLRNEASDLEMELISTKAKLETTASRLEAQTINLTEAMSNRKASYEVRIALVNHIMDWCGDDTASTRKLSAELAEYLCDHVVVSSTTASAVERALGVEKLPRKPEVIIGLKSPRTMW